MHVGYARVSTIEQNLDRQLGALEEAGAEKVYSDKASGKDTARPALTAMLDFVREGDTVLITSLDRLGRDLQDLEALINEMTDKGVVVVLIEDRLTFSGDDSPVARLSLQFMGAMAQFQRAKIREAQAEGIAKAKLRGVYKGRKPTLSKAQAAELCLRAADGEPVAKLAQEYEISRQTAYRYRKAWSRAA